jgi:hypothetical protein
LSVVKISEQKNKRRLLSLIDEFNEQYQQQLPTHDFKSIAVFDNYSDYVGEFFIRRLDEEITKNNDFMIINDIKYKHNELSISYTACNDYDDLIESLGSNG